MLFYSTFLSKFSNYSTKLIETNEKSKKGVLSKGVMISCNIMLLLMQIYCWTSVYISFESCYGVFLALNYLLKSCHISKAEHILAPCKLLLCVVFLCNFWIASYRVRACWFLSAYAMLSLSFKLHVIFEALYCLCCLREISCIFIVVVGKVSFLPWCFCCNYLDPIDL